MVKRKSNMSLFSTLVQEINPEPSSVEYHRIDNEYFAAFDSLDGIQEFHHKMNEAQAMSTDLGETEAHREVEDDHEMDMKTFAAQFLIDSPERLLTSSESSSDQAIREQDANRDLSRKRQRRNIRDLPQSSHFIFMSDDDDGNIFDGFKEKVSTHRPNRIAYEDMSSILLTLDIQGKKTRKHSPRTDNQVPTVAIELAEPSMIKTEPAEQEHVGSVCRISRQKKKHSFHSLLAHHRSCH